MTSEGTQAATDDRAATGGRRVLVVTTINPPTGTVTRTRQLRPEWEIIVVGDGKTPADWEHEGVRFLSLEEQRGLPFSLADALPTGHYSRKNVGYLDAISRGAAVIAETDDDNFPHDDFLADVAPEVTGRIVLDRGWVNAYRSFTDARIWPRGFDLDAVAASLTSHPTLAVEPSAHHCPVQQYLADGDPDVDAIYRLVGEGDVTFERNDPIVLPPGAHCPFNSQNTVWFPEAYPLLYLPSTVSFRMTDIWRSFVAARCLAADDLPVAFLPASVHQDRNAHLLLRDFAGEVDGYLNNAAIVAALGEVPMTAGDHHGNLRACYRRMHDMGHVASEELDLLEHWIADLERIGQPTAS